LNYTVTVAAAFNRDCPTCIADAITGATQAIKDRQVTSLTLRASEKCDHATGKTQRLPGSAAPLPGQQQLPGIAATDPPQVPNGFDAG
jgi:hypothetical protein